MAGVIPGFVGCGNIASAVVRGLCTMAAPPARVLVSPRSAAKSAALAAEFPGIVEIAPDNQAVVEGADVVVLSVLPKQLPEVAADLRFRVGQPVLSLIALVNLSDVRAMVAPAGPVARAVPLPSSARHLGPVAFCPNEPFVPALLSGLGTPIPTDDEAEFHSLWSLTGLIAPYFTLLETASAWAAAQGVPRALAKAYTASMAHALSVLAETHDAADFSALVEEAQTPGGLNEQAVRKIRAAGGFEAFPQALDSILRRLSNPVT